MKTLLILYPHWHPANLAGVQRPRLIGNFLKEQGWKPRVLTVEAQYFEETPDPDFEKTFSPDFEVTRVKAFKPSRPRIIGDIGLRAFFQLYRGARQIIKNESIDFIWLPIPSFYNALLGRLLYEKTKVPYGIDYIDPWVRDLTNQGNLRARISQFFARLLEPIAVKKASLISGVSFPYYEPVIKRNFPTIYAQITADKTKSSTNEATDSTSQQLTPNSSHSAFRNSGSLRITSQDSPLTSHNSRLPSQDSSLTTHPSHLITNNPHTHRPFTHVAMPYGFDPHDHQIKLENLQYPWLKTLGTQKEAMLSSDPNPTLQNTVEQQLTPHKSLLTTHYSPLISQPSPLTSHYSRIWLYAGAFLPNSHVLLNAFFGAIAELRQDGKWDNSIQLWFIGTGLYPAKRITAYAEDHKINDIVFEDRNRYPFLQVLNFLAAADTVMIIGSTEKHYTASKTYQSLLSGRPVVSVFHHESSAIQVMADCKADDFTMRYKPGMNHQEMVDAFKSILLKRLHTDQWNPDLSVLDKYSAKVSANMLVQAIESVI